MSFCPSVCTPSCHCNSKITSFGFKLEDTALGTKGFLQIRAATIIRLLGNKMIQLNTRGKKSEPGLRKQLNIDIKSTTKFYCFFKYMNIFIYFKNIRRVRFNILYFKYLQTLILCITTFYKTAFYYNVFQRSLKSRNIKMVKVSYILHYKCVFFPKFNKLSKFFPVVWFVTIL